MKTIKSGKTAAQILLLLAVIFFNLGPNGLSAVQAQVTCYTLTVAKNPTVGGEVSVTPPNCGSQYEAGTIVTLTATPNTGYGFWRWTGAAILPTTSSTPGIVTMDANKSVTANFVLKPSHDDFGGAKSFSGLPYEDLNVDVRGATTQSINFPLGADPDNVGPCESNIYLNQGNKTVWYEYAPGLTQPVSVDTIGSTYDTFIAVWTGTQDNLNLVECNDEGAGGASQLSFLASVGTTYYIQVAEFNGFEGGTLGGNLGGTLNFRVSLFKHNESSWSRWYGSASIISDQPLVAVGRPHIGEQIMTYGGFSSGSLVAYVPMLFKNMWGSYDSALYVQNVNQDDTANVIIKFYDTSGNLVCTKVDIISRLSSKGYWIPSETCLPSSWVGSAVITSDQDIVTVARPHIGSEITTYNGFASGGLTMYVPMLFKTAFGSYDSALYIQNIDQTGTANITIKFYDVNGSLSCTKNDTIQRLSSKGYWIPSESCLPAGWVGGAVITSNLDIVAVGRPHIGTQVTTYNGFAEGNLSTYVPMLFKNAFGLYDSALYVQNIDPVETANVTLKFYDTNGGLTCTKSDVIARLSSKGYWIPSETCLPSGWVGGVVVTSDKNTVAVGRPHLGSEITTYNGFGDGNVRNNVPMLFKNMWQTYNSAFYLQNIDALNTANVIILFYDVNGNLSCVRQDTIPALASLGYWLPSTTCSY